MDPNGKSRRGGIQALAETPGAPPSVRSMDADAAPDFRTTRPVISSGSRRFVNAAAARTGELTVQAAGPDRKALSRFTSSGCRPVRADGNWRCVPWNGAGDLFRPGRRPVSFRFQFGNARWFSFWLTSDTAGESHGYVAAGGPGFSGPADDVGREQI